MIAMPAAVKGSSATAGKAPARVCRQVGHGTSEIQIALSRCSAGPRRTEAYGLPDYHAVVGPAYETQSIVRWLLRQADCRISAACEQDPAACSGRYKSVAGRS
jgi:hypothetical protein